MNIRDIAKLADVSVSTVSKIMNRKDKDISDETRQKVLQIAEQYQYTPYAKVIDKINLNSKTIGILLPDVSQYFYGALVKQIEKNLFEKDYHVFLCNTDNFPAQSSEMIEKLEKRKVECVITFGKVMENQELKEKALLSQTPFITVDDDSIAGHFTRFSFDYEKGLQEIINHFTHLGYGQVPIVISSQNKTVARRFLSGYKKAYAQIEDTIKKTLIFTVEDHREDTVVKMIDGLIKSGHKAVIASHGEIAMTIYKYCHENQFKIPQELSVATLDTDNLQASLFPSIACICYPFEEMAAQITNHILMRSEEKSSSSNKKIPLTFVAGQSTIQVLPAEIPKIIVVGSINMDIILNVEEFPQSGETVLVANRLSLPGGKGANQAVCVSRLGGNAHLIGRLGDDFFGKELYQNLITNHVNAEAITFDEDTPSGNAYVYVSEKGEDSIGVYPGANSKLEVEQIKSCEATFQTAHFCLIQMEIPSRTIKYVFDLCKKNNVKIILKPAPAKKLTDKLLEGLYLLIPNETEIDQLCSSRLSLEEKARFFLQKGVENVIITLGDRGCFYACNKEEKYFPVSRFEPVDTTGASDIFIGTLAVFLAEGKSMNEAIHFANYTAGMSTASFGVQSAIPERNTLNFLGTRLQDRG